MPTSTIRHVERVSNLATRSAGYRVEKTAANRAAVAAEPPGSTKSPAPTGAPGHKVPRTYNRAAVNTGNLTTVTSGSKKRLSCAGTTAKILKKLTPMMAPAKITKDDQAVEQILETQRTLAQKILLCDALKEIIFLLNEQQKNPKITAINKSTDQKTTLAKLLDNLRNEANEEIIRLEAVKKINTEATKADARAAAAALASSVVSVAAIFFAPLSFLGAGIDIYVGAEWARSAEVVSQGELTPKSKPVNTSKITAILVDATKGIAGVTFGVAAGLVASSTGMAATIASPILFTISAAGWFGASANKTAKNPALANALGSVASIANAVAMGFTIATLAGTGVTSGKLIISTLTICSAGLWVISTIKNFVTRRGSEKLSNTAPTLRTTSVSMQHKATL